MITVLFLYPEETLIVNISFSIHDHCSKSVTHPKNGLKCNYKLKKINPAEMIYLKCILVTVHRNFFPKNF